MDVIAYILSKKYTDKAIEGVSGTGKDGVTFTPSVSEEGILSWTNDGDLPNPDPVNIKGESSNYNIGNGLKLDKETNTLSVDVATEVSEDNTLPITSAAVYTEIGNINVLLQTI